MSLRAPEPLGSTHVVQDFSCGVPSLNMWLKQRALKNQISGASRTYVVCERNNVTAYYALAAGNIHVGDASGRFRRNMPDPVPVVVLGRLAVDSAWRGQGIGRAMIQDVILRILQAADVIGIRGVVVHALSEGARAFYEHVGFDPSPLNHMTLMATIQDLQACFPTTP